MLNIKFKKLRFGEQTAQIANSCPVTSPGKVVYHKITYARDTFENIEMNVDDIPSELPNNRVTWIRINGTEHHQLEKLEQKLKLHHLTTKDIILTAQRARFEDHENYGYLIMQGFSLSSNQLEQEQISIIFFHNCVVTISEGENDFFHEVFKKIHYGSRARGQDSVFLLYKLIRATLYSYFEVFEELNDRMDKLEDQLLENDTKDTLISIRKLKKEILMLHKSLWPLRETLGYLMSFEMIEKSKDKQKYFADLQTEVSQMIDEVEVMRDILSGMMDMYISNNSNKMNEVMKVLTLVSTIFMPLTFIVGIYGMNFQNMPELRSHWGYPGIWAIMVLTAIFMIYYFKKRKWFDKES